MSNTQSLIEQLYQEEQKRLADEATFTPLDISVSASDMAMVNTIAKRFGKNKNLFAREALTQALVDMFSALEPAERKMLAKEADELANSIAAEIAEEQGLSDVAVAGTNWVAQDKACVREAKKAEKERQKMEQAAAASMTAETNMSDMSEEPTEMAMEEETADSANDQPFAEETAEAEEAPTSIFGTN